jgi:ribose 5-phosphate isomerase RpiB
MRIAIGSDHAGFDLKQNIVQYLKSRHEVRTLEHTVQNLAIFQIMQKKSVKLFLKVNMKEGFLFV